MLVGTRGSLLATTQSQWAVDQITAATGTQGELVIIRTEGDDVTIPLANPSRPGAFVAALRDALIDGKVDVAVHSTKDLPSGSMLGLTIAAFPPRENPSDVVVGSTLDELAPGARVGTSSPRRELWLQQRRPDLVIVPIRGNVDTRIRKVRDGEVDAAILAAAGMDRLGRLDEAAEILDPLDFIPAPGQGALAIECRVDSPFRSAITSIDDPATRLCVTAERAVLRGIEATCTTPIGAYATLKHDELTLIAALHDRRVERSITLPKGHELDHAESLGFAVAQELLG